MGQAKENPVIAETLSLKLVQATGEDDVAAAITEAKTETRLLVVEDPVERKKI